MIRIIALLLFFALPTNLSYAGGTNSKPVDPPKSAKTEVQRIAAQRATEAEEAKERVAAQKKAEEGARELAEAEARDAAMTSMYSELIFMNSELRNGLGESYPECCETSGLSHDT
jgi:hypothetical protein